MIKVSMMMASRYRNVMKMFQAIRRLEKGEITYFENHSSQVCCFTAGSSFFLTPTDSSMRPPVIFRITITILSRFQFEMARRRASNRS